MSRVRITNTQLAALVGQFLYVTAITTPGRLMAVTGAGAWLSVILGVAVGLLALVLAFKLAGPQRVDLFGAIEHRLGAGVGRCLASCYALYFLIVVAWDLRWANDWFAGAALQRTPLIVVLGSWALVLGVTVFHGPEVISRANVASFLFMIVMITAIPLLAMNNLNPAYFRPLFERGPGPMFRAAYLPAGWAAESIALSVFLPFTALNRQTRQASLIGAVLGLFLLECMVGAAIGAFGPDLGPSLTYPAVSVVRMVAPVALLERIDYALISAWSPAYTLRMASTLYAASVALSRACGLRQPRPLTWASTLFVFTLAHWGWRSNASLQEHGMAALPGLSLVMGIIVPGLLVLLPVRNRAKAPGE